MSSIEAILQLLLQGFINTGLFLATVVLPTLALCFVLLIVSRWMNDRLLKMFGWRGVLALAWLGTPVHELSHAIACIIGRNRIEEIRLFRPDKTTGVLGYVKRSYDRKSFYQRTIGNTLIAVAPFFGGALVIWLLTYFLYPSLLTFARNFAIPSLAEVGSLAGLGDYAESVYATIKQFSFVLFSMENLTTWQFWAYLFTMISVAAYLSPSSSDFNGFWPPVIVLVVLLFLFQTILLFIGEADWIGSFNLPAKMLVINSLLVLSLFFLLIGAGFVGSISLVVWLLKAIFR